jgi:hypothetical protein
MSESEPNELQHDANAVPVEPVVAEAVVEEAVVEDGAVVAEEVVVAETVVAESSSALVLPAPPATQPFALTIGDIGITADTIVTPNGSAPLKGSQWIVVDQSVTERKIPTWAIVCAIIFALLCLLGLLFLLVKEEQTRGYVQVQVRSGDLLHSVQLPVSSPQQVVNARAAVSQAQTMAAAA